MGFVRCSGHTESTITNNKKEVTVAHFNVTPDRASLHGKFSRDHPPILTIDSGDTVCFQTLDAGWGLEPHHSDGTPRAHFEPKHPERDAGHALCGPIAIRGAEPGMTLEVRIDALRPASWGWNLAGGWPSMVNTRLGLDQAPEFLNRWDLDTVAGIGTNHRGFQVALRPFLGVMGMPANEPGLQSTTPPRATGGNLDCKELVEGSTLYLPIEVAGGLFSTGDGHAAQGDGEVSSTAIECPMEKAQLTFVLHPNMHVLSPRANTPAGWIKFGLSPDLNEAMFLALEEMIALMAEMYSISRQEALSLASLVVDLRITQVVNTVWGVHAVLPHGALRRQPGRHL